MTDHHDFGYDDGGHHFDDGHHDPLPSFEDSPAPDDHLAWDDFGHDDPGHDDGGHLEVDQPHEIAVPLEETHHDISDMPELTQPAEDLFPPTVDVGELPEPVDGFPWIDSGSLGLADIQAALHEADTTVPVHPQDLAEYAATDLPPGEDPWATLADSDDPATAALAKWWQQN